MSEQTQTDPILEAALEYAAMGWAVFPTGGPGLTTKDPHPSVGRWSQASTADPQGVVALFTGLQGPVGIGLDCGKSGLVALDVDRPSEATGAILSAREASWVLQGNRDRYTLLRASDGSVRCPVQPWGEVKGAGGYIVLPPTTHVSGVPYQWVQRPGWKPKPLPKGLAETLVSHGNAANEATSLEVQAFMDTHQEAARPGALGVPVGMVRNAARDGHSLHPKAQEALVMAMDEAASGAYAARQAADAIHEAWLTGYRDQGRTPRPDHKAEWASMVRWAVGQVLDQTPEERAERRRRLGIVAVADVSQEPEDDTPDLPPVLPEDFWGARVSLAHVRQAARARIAGPDGLLLSVLVRVATSLDASWVLPPIVEAPASPNLYGAMVLGSGGGKSSAKAMAEELAPLPRPLIGLSDDGDTASTRGTVKTVTMGTGEGLVEALGTKDGRAWVKGGWGLLVDSDEVDAFLGSAGLGASTTATLRTAWSGGALGASQRNSPTAVAALDYRLGLLLGAQPERTAGLMVGKEAHGGTPQRFLWLAVLVDDDLTLDNLPEWPGALDWRPWSRYGKTVATASTHAMVDSHGSEVTRYGVPVDDQVAMEIRRDHLAQKRSMSGTLGGHRNLLRLKVALALGLLERADADPEVTEEDWRLAGVLLDTSDGVREWMVERGSQAAVQAAAEAIRVRKTGERTADETIARVAGVLERALEVHGGQTRKVLRTRLRSADRHWLDDALAHLQAHGRAVRAGSHWVST